VKLDEVLLYIFHDEKLKVIDLPRALQILEAHPIPEELCTVQWEIFQESTSQVWLHTAQMIDKKNDKEFFNATKLAAFFERHKCPSYYEEDQKKNGDITDLLLWYTEGDAFFKLSNEKMKHDIHMKDCIKAACETLGKKVRVVGLNQANCTVEWGDAADQEEEEEVAGDDDDDDDDNADQEEEEEEEEEVAGDDDDDDDDNTDQEEEEEEEEEVAGDDDDDDDNTDQEEEEEEEEEVAGDDDDDDDNADQEEEEEEEPAGGASGSKVPVEGLRRSARKKTAVLAPPSASPKKRASPDEVETDIDGKRLRLLSEHVNKSSAKIQELKEENEELKEKLQKWQNWTKKMPA
jgi:hypothetical protein